MARRRPEKPLVKQAAEFVIFHLADKTAFHPFTGTDYDAWHAYVPLVRLWGRTRSEGVVTALREVVHSAQVSNPDVMAVFKKAIPCVLDWSDEPALWRQIGPRAEMSDITKARIVAGLTRYGMPEGDPVRVMWPCSDGARVCRHTNSRPYKGAVPEPGYTLDQECKDCGAIWREKYTANVTTT